ncbi:hypothetical protein CC2G_011780 [Coprinopsis cinerea AmutBmut pab1-1]|nr:hypothetical protein CC2G_011780 [Coprinopsis cinerea AmutBmut pab1-1]
MTATSTEVNVSLEPHLVEVLKPVRTLLPEALAAELASYIEGAPKDIIPHRLLREISSWSRSDEGIKRLRSKSIGPSTLSMVSLLAGTTTSPERNFGEYVPTKEPEEVAYDKARERKAITALVNSLFSVFGAGFAAWWGADKTGWKDEYKVLFAIGVGIVVAISEAILYWIWSSRKTSSKQKRRITPNARHKKLDGGGTATEEARAVTISSKDEKPNNLRQRRDPTSR